MSTVPDSFAEAQRQMRVQVGLILGISITSLVAVAIIAIMVGQTGPILGLSIGSLVVVAIIAFVIITKCKRRMNTPPPPHAAEAQRQMRVQVGLILGISITSLVAVAIIAIMIRQTGPILGLSIGSLVVVAIIAIVIIKKLTRIRAVMNPPPPPPPQPLTTIQVDDPTMEKFLEELAQLKPVRFMAQHLCDFTNNYSTMLGSGGFGKVYKGEFPNGVKIAVKVLNRGTANERIEEQFMAEVGTIGRTHHINLVRLYGFCYDQFISALVFEFMENGSLDKLLFSDNAQELQWEKLHEIAVGTAKGIVYLHEECQQRIIHYDIKPGNVLLDENFSPKVADFGLAKLCNRDDTHVSVTGYRGTPGYLAPEFMLRNFPITFKCDVYSFGILLFEIVGRRRNTKVGGNSESLSWFPKQVWEGYEKGELMAMIEACEIEEKDRAKVERTAMVALWCVQDTPGTRPPMSAVVKMLEGGVEIVPPPKPFHYLSSVGTNVLKPPTHWYKARAKRRFFRTLDCY